MYPDFIFCQTLYFFRQKFSHWKKFWVAEACKNRKVGGVITRNFGKFKSYRVKLTSAQGIVRMCIEMPQKGIRMGIVRSTIGNNSMDKVSFLWSEKWTATIFPAIIIWKELLFSFALNEFFWILQMLSQLMRIENFPNQLFENINIQIWFIFYA